MQIQIMSLRKRWLLYPYFICCSIRYHRLAVQGSNSISQCCTGQPHHTQIHSQALNTGCALFRVLTMSLI